MGRRAPQKNTSRFAPLGGCSYNGGTCYATANLVWNSCAICKFTPEEGGVAVKPGDLCAPCMHETVQDCCKCAASLYWWAEQWELRQRFLQFAGSPLLPSILPRPAQNANSQAHPHDGQGQSPHVDGEPQMQGPSSQYVASGRSSASGSSGTETPEAAREFPGPVCRISTANVQAAVPSPDTACAHLPQAVFVASPAAPTVWTWLFFFKQWMQRPHFRGI